MNNNMYVSFTKNIVIFCFVLLGFLSFAFSAYALTVSPVRVELEAAPGEVVIGTYRVANDSPNKRTYYPLSQNFEAQGESGIPQFVDAEEGLASWISTDSSLTLEPYESREIPYEITIPTDAQPGGYFAAMFWASQPTEGVSGNTIGYRVGVLVLMSVEGEITEDGGIIDFQLNDSSGSVAAGTASYRFRNDGSDRLLPSGDVVITNMFGKEIERMDANTQNGNVLPGSARYFEIPWQTYESTGFWSTVMYQFSNLYIGKYTFSLELNFGQDKTLSDSQNLSHWIIPWQLLLSVAGVIAILFSAYRILVWKIKQSIRSEIQQESSGE